MTGENGQGTKYHSKNADHVGNIDKLLSILSNYKKSPEFKISGTLTKNDPNGLWLMIGQLTKSMTKQRDVVDKTMEIVDEIKGNGGVMIHLLEIQQKFMYLALELSKNQGFTPTNKVIHP